MHSVTPVFMGCITAVLAVVAQAYLSVAPPPAYGLCIVCHGRDLIIWCISLVTNIKPEVASVSTTLPLLTVVGVLMGANYAAREHNEYNHRWIEPPIIAFLSGMAIMVLGLIIMACPARLLLRAAYGDPTGLAGIVAVLVGTSVATLLTRWRAK